jgi:signal transduction histidine kinase
VIAAFALGGLALSAGLAIMTYEAARTYLLDQRERSVVRQTYAAASVVESELLAPEPDIPRVLSSLVMPAPSQAVLLHDGRWYAVSLQVGRDDIPESLRDRASTGTSVRQLFRIRGEAHLAVGLPLTGGDGAFFEVSSLEELDRTLRVLRNALAGAAIVTTLAGAAVGTWIGERLLRPLADTAGAAAAVGSGRLDVRLERTGDSDLDTLAEAFNGMTAALRDRIERDARFASAVSHELRSPLTTLATSVQVLRGRREEMPEPARAALDLLEGDVRRFQRLVEELLEMSRIGAGVVEVSLEAVRPDELAAHALRSAGAASVPIDLDPSVSGLVIHVDKRRMERVIVNLVENAQTHGGGIVRVAIEANGSRVRLAVEDRGPGVPPDDRERIFEPFVRGRAAGRRGSADGTGLGLALVAEHVRILGGRVWAQDRPGGGARFVVELPASLR